MFVSSSDDRMEPEMIDASRQKAPVDYSSTTVVSISSHDEDDVSMDSEDNAPSNIVSSLTSTSTESSKSLTIRKLDFANDERKEGSSIVSSISSHPMNTGAPIGINPHIPSLSHEEAQHINHSNARNGRKRSRSPTQDENTDSANLILPHSKRRRVDLSLKRADHSPKSVISHVSLTSNMRRMTTSAASQPKPVSTGCFLENYISKAVTLTREPDESYDRKYPRNRDITFQLRLLRPALNSDDVNDSRGRQRMSSSSSMHSPARSSRSSRVSPNKSEKSSHSAQKMIAPASPTSVKSVSRSRSRSRSSRKRRRRSSEMNNSQDVVMDGKEAESDQVLTDVSNFKIWLSLTDLLKGFSYRSNTKAIKDARICLIDSLQTYLRDNMIENPITKFLVKFRGRFYVSEEGFCLTISILADYDPANHLVGHWKNHRFAYRHRIFGSELIHAPDNDTPYQFICFVCGLEDAADKFIHVCECGIATHVRCPLDPGFVLPQTSEEEASFFCKLCRDHVKDEEVLLERRERANQPNASFEVEQVLQWNRVNNDYLVKWKYYPGPSNERIPLTTGFLELVEIYWRHWKESNPGKNIPGKARKVMKEVSKDPSFVRKRKNLIVDQEQLGMGTGGKKHKPKSRVRELNMPKMQDLGDAVDPRHVAVYPGFIPVKLTDIMEPEYITHVQLYTQVSQEKKQEFEGKCRKALERKMKQKKLKKLPKYFLENTSAEWDVDIDRNKKQVEALLNRNWTRWSKNCDTAQDCYVIGEITDPENPVMRCQENSIHQNAVYGLFAVKDIEKHTVLFEYAGVVNTAGAAEAPLNHIEHELDQTTLFHLQGHKSKNRNKNIWGDTPNHAMLVDPHVYHNEGVYMNDYRDDIYADPDDEPDPSDVSDTESESDEDVVMRNFPIPNQTNTIPPNPEEKQPEEADAVSGSPGNRRPRRQRKTGPPKGIYGVTTYSSPSAAVRLRKKKKKKKKQSKPKKQAIREDSPDSIIDEHGVRRQKRRPNVQMYEVLVNHWPRILAVSTRRIKAGDELLTDYGQEYWRNYIAMLQRNQQLNEIKDRIIKEQQQEKAEALGQMQQDTQAAIVEMVELMRENNPDLLDRVSFKTMELGGYTIPPVQEQLAEKMEVEVEEMESVVEESNQNGDGIATEALP